jgi:SAM-dependent methyltransferase
MTSEVWKDAAVAARFAAERAARLPETASQLAALLHVLRCRGVPPRRFLDLGCGDALLLAALLAAFPGSTGVAVDFSPFMLERARERVRAFGRAPSSSRGTSARRAGVRRSPRRYSPSRTHTAPMAAA